MIRDWESFRQLESNKSYWAELQQFVADERSRGEVFPSDDQVYAALDLTPLHKVRVVILGQDPYHGPGQAHGLAFSVRPGVRPPPSLKNIFKELEDDLGLQPPTHGNLEHWAREGVLLLNAALTVRAADAGSHLKHWRRFTDEALSVAGTRPDPTVFMLWGKKAQRKKPLIAGHHLVIESPHPSGLSAYRGFLGSKPFSRANEFLGANGRGQVDWRVPEL